MPKNTVGGKKYKQQKHKTDDLPNKPLLEREEGQEYAVVTKLLGNSRVSGLFYDRELKQAREIICILRPGLKKKRQWAKMGSIILISLRDFEKDKAGVIHVYNEEETKKLKRKNILDSQLLNRDGEGGEDEFGFLDNEDEDDEILEKPKKKKEVRPKNNISIQDFGLPPIESSDDELDNV